MLETHGAGLLTGEYVRPTDYVLYFVANTNLDEISFTDDTEETQCTQKTRISIKKFSPALHLIIQ